MKQTPQETLAGQIKALKIGASVSRTKRLDLTDEGRTAANENLAVLRNQINQAVGRIRKDQPGSNFRVESAVGLTDDKKALLATVACTRLDGGADNTDDDEEVDI